jgi:hypothetical protein
MASYVLCKNGHRNDRKGGRRKCVECGATFPAKRVTAHKRKLRDTGYAEWERVSNEIHGAVVEYGACGVCGRMPIGKRHDRDHDHTTGNIRGLACTGDFGCNRMMPRGLTWQHARGIAGYIRAGFAGYFSPYLPRDMTDVRADQIADYLERVEQYYAAVPRG